MYRSRDLVTVPITPARHLVLAPSTGTAAQLAAPIAQALSTLTAFKPLAAHVADLCARFGTPPGGPARLEHALEECRAAGLLMAADEVRGAMRATDEDVPAISTLAVPTRDRPASVERALDSFTANARAHGHAPRLLVVDDSTTDAAAHNRVALSRVAQRYAVEASYAGAAEKRAFAAALVAEADVDPAVVETALFDPEHVEMRCGANRNALTLATIDELVLCMDDDVTCRGVAGDPSMLRLTSVADPMRAEVHADRDAVLRAYPESTWDVIGAHARLLGRSPAAIAGTVTLDDVSAALVSRLMANTARVRVVQAGLYGDCGAAYTAFYLWREDVRDQLADDAIYARCATSRELRRAAPVTTIGDTSHCQSTLLAFDHRAVLPAFSPVERGSDLIFGRMLGRHFGGSALLGHLPDAILHAPLATRTADPDLSAAARVTTFAMVIHALLDAHAPPASAIDEADAVIGLGHHLATLGRLPAADFTQVVRTRLWIAMAREIQELTRRLESPGAGAAWSAGLRRYIAVRHESLAAIDTMVVPHTLRGDATLLQRLVRRYGELLVAWPAILDAARRLRARGVVLAQGTV